MEMIREYVRRHVRDDTVRFVFPSEVVAGFWRREAVRSSGVRAVRPSRFISWDTFKERAFTVRREDRPVNGFARNVFAYTYLQKNITERNLLPGFIAPEYADNSPALQRFLAMHLPALKNAVEQGTDETGELAALLDEYTRFLETNRMFEPQFESLEFEGDEGRVFFFFPELLEDIDDFRADLQRSEGVVLVPGAAEPAGAYRTLVFDNSRIETKWLINKIMHILHSGEAAPHQIWITLADDGMRNELKTLSSLYGVPLEFKKGKPLAEYMPVRILGEIRECMETGFSPASLRRLLLNGSVPWGRPDLNRRLLSFGIESFGLRNYRSGGRLKDRWAEELKKRGNKGLLEYYRELKKHCSRLLGAEDFQGLSSSLREFTAAFFAEGNWTEENRPVFQLAAEVLGELEIESAGLSGFTGIRPFQFFLQTLEERLYVPKTEGGGIPVYDYRVSAGGYPAVHFIAGLNQDSAQAVIKKYPFYSQQKKDRIGVEDTDMTGLFAETYTRSGASVYMTASAVTASGSVIVPELMLSGENDPEADGTVSGWSDIFDDERSLWSRETGGMSMVLPVQSDGFSFAERTVFREPGKGFAEKVVPGPLADQLVEQLLKDGALHLSPTGIELFFHCPYRFYLMNCLHLEETDDFERAVDPAVAGILYHNVLNRLFSRIKEQDGRFVPGKIEEYKNILEEIIPDVFTEYSQSHPKFLDPGWTEIKQRCRTYAAALIDIEAEKFPDYRIVTLEFKAQENLLQNLRGGQVFLKGYIDRISASNRGHLIIDYKSKAAVRIGDVQSSGTEGRALQLPLYVRLAEAAGYPVNEAYYASLRDKKYVPIMSDRLPKAITPGEMSGIIEEADQLIDEMIKRIDEGIYTVPRDDADGSRCGGCGFRTVCRQRYTVR